MAVILGIRTPRIPIPMSGLLASTIPAIRWRPESPSIPTAEITPAILTKTAPLVQWTVGLATRGPQVIAVIIPAIPMKIVPPAPAIVGLATRGPQVIAEMLPAIPTRTVLRVL